MILLTKDLKERLLANGRQPGTNHVPVVKFFNPLGAGTWLATELYADGYTLFGLADPGFGCPEFGNFRLSELAIVRLPFGLGIERDLLFPRDFPISVWAKEARQAGSIRAAEPILYDCARGDTLLIPKFANTETRKA